jgi:hypothetical protein
MPGGSRETFLVVYKNEAGRRGVAPAPEHEIEVGGRGSPGEGRDEECGVACGDEASRKLLRLGFAAGHHFIAPGDGGEISRTHAKPGERHCVAGVEDGANVGVVGEERGRLKRADLIRFTSSAPAKFIVFDLGNASGRVYLGALEDDRLQAEEVYRFASGPTRAGPRWLGTPFDFATR